MRLAPLAFGSALQERVNARAADLLPAAIPELLAHYTTYEAVASIAGSRNLRATCLADQRDVTELEDAVRILEECANRAVPYASEFGRSILQHLVGALKQRRDWLFITCFCADFTSSFHFKEYGAYRLAVPIHNALGLSLRPDMFQSDCWIRPCIYDQDVFRKFGDDAIQDFVSTLQAYSDGELSGPWATSIAQRSARDVAQVLLTVAASVKHPKFDDDREVRLICSPLAGVANSAPASLDQDFLHWVKTEVRGSRRVRYVELWNYPRSKGGRDDVPFSAVVQNPSARDEEERRLLNEVLDKNTVVVCQ